MEIKDRVAEVLQNALNLEKEDLLNTASLEQDLACDCSDTLECIMALEEEFNIRIPDTAITGLTTVEQIVEYIQGRLK